MPSRWLTTLVLALSGAAAGLASATAHAQDFEAKARLTRADFESARSEDQVSRDQADRAAAGSVGDALERAPGVVVQRTSSASSAPIVRGLTGNRVLLVLDDLRLNDPLTRPGGHALLNLIDPESVDRIEVIRGPASVLYGSDALGGVVHVRTAGTDASPTNEKSAGGSVYARGASAEQAMRVQGSVRAALGPLGARISGGRGHASELIRGGTLGEQPFTGHDDWTFASRLELAPSRDHRFSLAHQSGHLWDAPRTDVSTPEDRQTTETLDRESAWLGYRGRLAGPARVRLQAYAGLVLRREWRQRLRDGEVGNERDRVLGYQGGVRVAVAPFATSSLEVGAETVIEDIASAAETIADGMTTRERGRYVDDSHYDTYGLYALWSQELSATWTAMAGARATLVNAQAPIDPLFPPEIGRARRLDRRLFGVVGSLGVRWEATSGLSWMASLLSGFRAPNLEDFQALGGGARGFTVPNPDLDEERSWTAETGVKWNDGGWELDGYLFASLLTGLIERVPSELDGMTEIDGARVQSPQNASRSVLLGSELTVLRRLPIGVYSGLSAFATWGETVRPDSEGNDVTEPASKTPPPIFALQSGFDHRSLPYYVQTSLTMSLPQSRLSESDTNDVRICEEGPEGCDEEPGWVDLSVRTGLKLDEHVLIAVAIENIFDTGYKTFASGAYAPGRNFMLGVRGTL
jgi:outer membrane receptor protein involved in Fe transport